MKKFLMIAIVVAVLASLMAMPVLAKGPSGPAGRSNVGHIYLGEKTEAGPDGIIGTPDDWQLDMSNAWGKLRYELSNPTLNIVLNARGLTPGDWYYIELVDKSPGWNPISPNNYSSFYAQANVDGNIHAALSCAVGSGMRVEANVKNAEWAALLDPSTIGVPSEWAGPTGQGWDYVLYSEDTITIP